MSFAADRALQALSGVLLTPTAAERTSLAARATDATTVPPSPIVVPVLSDARDALEELETRRSALQTILPSEGTSAVVSVAAPRRELGEAFQGGGPGPFGGGRRSAGFVLTAVRENLNEKYQIYQTFAGYILYSMGRAPSIYTFSGYLLNTKTADAKQFVSFYNQHMRASATVASGVPASVSYMNSVAKGYVIGVRVGHKGESPGASEFSFDMLLG